MTNIIDNDKINELEKRIKDIENKLVFLYRNLGIDYSNDAPEKEIPPNIKDLILRGKKRAAIKEFKRITGSSLKDAKVQIEKAEKEIRR